MKLFLLITLGFALSLAVFHTYISPEFPYTNDGENHLARFANYKIALKEGQIPPRFAPNLMNHYGYPVFNYNYPLANIFSVPFSVLKVNPEVTFKLISFCFYVFGLVGMYKLLRQYKSSMLTLITGMAVFGTQPYIVNLILYRGSIGELMAVMLLPWVLWSLRLIESQRKFSIFVLLIFVLFLLSHNVTVFISAPFLLMYLAVLLHRNKSWKVLPHYVLHGIVAVTLSLWFWLPAVLEADQTVVKEAGIANQFIAHLVTFSQLLFGQMQFGFSIPGPLDSLGFQLGFPSFFIIAISLIIFIKKLLTKTIITAKSIFFLLTVLLLIFLQLGASTFFWQLFPFLQIIQFPWRLSILLCVFIPLLWSDSSQYTGRLMKKVFLLFIFIHVYMVAQLKPVDSFHRNQIDYDLFTQSTSTQNENRTKEFSYLEIGDWQPAPKIVGKGKSTVQHWTGSDRIYQVVIDKPSTVIEPTMNFSGWETRVTDEGNKTSRVSYKQGGDTQGRIAYDLSPGSYVIHSRFTQNTPARLIGNGISLLTLIAVMIYSVKQFLLNKRTHSIHERE